MQDIIPVSIDINDSPTSFCVTQHDNLSRKIVMRISDRDNPDEKKINLDSHRVCLFCLLPDGESKVRIDGQVTDGENGVMQFVLTDAVTSDVGTVVVTPVICCGDELISLRRFSFAVLPCDVTAAEIEQWKAADGD